MDVAVTPNWAAEHLTIEIQGMNRVTLHNMTHNVESGEVVFYVRGKSPTPDNKVDGDTTLVARIGQDILDEAKVLVLVPRTVSGDNVNGPVSGVNQLADHCSSPKYAGPLAQGAVCLWTHYVHKTTLTVRDQFGDVLDDLYNGAEVTEHANQIPINQYVYSGEYTDPVGMIRYRRDPSDPNNDNPHTKYYIFQADSKEAKAWPTESLVPMANYDKTQSISVQVGGHELSPGIVGRRVITNPANNNISIQW